MDRKGGKTVTLSKDEREVLKDYIFESWDNMSSRYDGQGTRMMQKIFAKLIR